MATPVWRTSQTGLTVSRCPPGQSDRLNKAYPMDFRFSEGRGLKSFLLSTLDTRTYS